MGSAALARVGWQALWPMELVLRHRLFQFGLGRLMGFDERLLRRHFTSFFQLSQEDWSGFLTNTLPLPQLMGCDAALVCDFTLGCAARVGAGGASYLNGCKDVVRSLSTST